MSEPSKENLDLQDDELVPEDDAVIGRAVRRSLIALAVIAVLGALAFFLVRRPPAAGPEKAIAAAPPQTREAPASGPPEVRFTDITQQAGIDFVHTNGAYGMKLLPETMGGGAAFFDFDGDGDQDLLLVDSSTWPGQSAPAERSTPRLYRNDGTGRFTDATAAAGLAGVSLYGMGPAVGDYDGDGDPDLYLTAVGEGRLLRNQGGVFEDVTRQAGVAGSPDDWSTCAAFFDADNDGRLDLFVCNYVRWSREIDLKLDYRLTGIGRAYGPPNNYEGTWPRFYRNRGDGTFEDVSAASGVQVANPATGKPAAKALGVAPVDADGDGWMDLLVANDTAPNFFLRNQGNGRFVETGTESGLAFDRMGNATGAMGVDAAHYRNDADLAFVIGNFANEMTSLYVAQGDPSLFADEAIPEGIGAPSRQTLKFGIFFFDYDLDGRLDLLQANGHLEQEINQVDPSQQYRQPAQLFWNAGPEARQTFAAVPAASMGDLAKPLVGRGAAYADIDRDGDLDVFITQPGDRPLLLRNDQALGHHWLRVKLVGSGGNREAIGARVTLTAGGGITQTRQVMPTRSYLSQCELPVTFGLGKTAKVDSLMIRWPGDGGEERVENVPVDREVVVEQGKGR
ncbi:MAG TPA: CRTAC1 family protein [Thermoanaerobaculia bacterium]|nr:CRTAC1 family protein [Thermoanaerobaculia bacterium]